MNTHSKFALGLLILTATPAFAAVPADLGPGDLARLAELEATLEKTAAEADRATDDDAPILSRAFAADQSDRVESVVD